MKHFLNFFIFVLCVLSSYSALSNTYSFWSITEALECETIDRNDLTKIIIEGPIAGTDYSEGSEWREFRTLDTTFPNIEAVEIWTEQDIPKGHWITDKYGLGLFSMQLNEWDVDGRPVTFASNWLKKFTAPNIKILGSGNFHSCEKIETISLPSAEIIGAANFCWCYNLVEINFNSLKNIHNGVFHNANNLKKVIMPLLEKIDWGVFTGCFKLDTIIFGTGFDYTKELILEWAVFGDSINLNSGVYENSFLRTKNITLTLGEFVLPKPNTFLNTWQGTNSGLDDYDYVWKKIEIISDIKEETNTVSLPYLGNNSYLIECIEYAELFDVLGRKIMYIEEGQEILDLSSFVAGLYFLKYKQENKNFTSKLIRY